MVPVPESELPVKLPEVKNYEPTGTGQSPLAVIPEWVNVKCPKCGGDAKEKLIQCLIGQVRAGTICDIVIQK